MIILNFIRVKHLYFKICYVLIILMQYAVLKFANYESKYFVLCNDNYKSRRTNILRQYIQIIIHSTHPYNAHFVLLISSHDKYE